MLIERRELGRSMKEGAYGISLSQAISKDFVSIAKKYR